MIYAKKCRKIKCINYTQHDFSIRLPFTKSIPTENSALTAHSLMSHRQISNGKRERARGKINERICVSEPTTKSFDHKFRELIFHYCCSSIMHQLRLSNKAITSVRARTEPRTREMVLLDRLDCAASLPNSQHSPVLPYSTMLLD